MNRWYYWGLTYELKTVHKLRGQSVNGLTKDISQCFYSALIYQDKDSGKSKALITNHWILNNEDINNLQKLIDGFRGINDFSFSDLTKAIMNNKDIPDICKQNLQNIVEKNKKPIFDM